MNITFLRKYPLNTVIVSSEDERPLYEVKTPFKWAGRTTSIRRVDFESVGLPEQGQLLAEIHWRAFSPTRVIFLGTEKPKETFLRKTGGFLSRSRIFTGADGREYKWEHSYNTITLTDCETDAMVAQSHRGKPELNISSAVTSPPSNYSQLTDRESDALVTPESPRSILIGKRKINVDILEQGIQNIDLIVVTLVIMEEMQQKRERSG